MVDQSWQNEIDSLENEQTVANDVEAEAVEPQEVATEVLEEFGDAAGQKGFSDEKAEDAAQLEIFNKSTKTVEGITGKKKKRIFTLLLILASILTVAIIAWIEFSGNKPTVPISVILSTWGKNWIFIVLALLALVAANLLDAFKMSLMLKSTTKKFRFKVSLKTVLLGRYWDNITPSALGGQPYQMYYLSKNEVPLGVSTSVPISSFVFQQMAFSIIAIAAFVFKSHLFTSTIMQVAAYIGVLCMVIIPLSIVVFSLLPKTAHAVIRFFLKIFHKMRIVKNFEKTEKKATAAVSDYISSIRHIGKSKLIVPISILVSIVSQLLNFSIAYLVVRACGYNEPWENMVALAIFTACAVAFVPTPGSSGAAESAFYVIFGMLQGGFLFWGMLIWRFITYYLPVLAGIMLMSNDYIKRIIRERKLRKQQKKQ